jgi:hypothetical protein
VDNLDTSKHFSVVTGKDGNYQLSVTTGVPNRRIVVPQSIELEQNYPNPFSSSTAISYKVNRQSDVSIRIYNILGQEIKAWTMAAQARGSHGLLWDGRNDFGEMVIPGIYFYQMRAGNETQANKMIFAGGGPTISVPFIHGLSSNVQALEKEQIRQNAARTYAVQIKNTDSTRPKICPIEFNEVIIQSDSVLNFIVKEDTIYIDIYGKITKEESPFYINGAARVPNGKTLIIEPGVTIFFKSANFDSCDYNWIDSTVDIGFLRVDGKLIAEGTKSDSIVFTRDKHLPNYYWGCIYFSETADSNSIISFSRVEYTSTIDQIDSRVHGDGITCWFSTIAIRSNLIQNSGNTYGIYLQNSETVVENNLIKNCYFGIGTWAFDQFAYLQPVIRNNIIIKNTARSYL